MTVFAKAEKTNARLGLMRFQEGSDDSPYAMMSMLNHQNWKISVNGQTVAVEINNKLSYAHDQMKLVSDLPESFIRPDAFSLYAASLIYEEMLAKDKGEAVGFFNRDTNHPHLVQFREVVADVKTRVKPYVNEQDQRLVSAKIKNDFALI